jgi:hypothetical protein
MAAVTALACPYDIHTLNGDADGTPLMIHARSDSDANHLASWIAAHQEWISERLATHGALLFRGFEIGDAPAFERIARAVDAELKNEYLGTSPRNALTDYVFTASELPPYYPIPQHCEMSFIAHPPRRLFFCCLVPPVRGSGETPLADFRKVLHDLDPDVRQRFEQRGLRIVRNYSGPGGGGRACHGHRAREARRQASVRAPAGAVSPERRDLHRVRRLRVPVLPSSVAHRETGARHVWRFHPVRLSELSAPEPPLCQAGRRSRPGLPIDFLPVEAIETHSGAIQSDCSKENLQSFREDGGRVVRQKRTERCHHERDFGAAIGNQSARHSRRHRWRSAQVRSLQ